MRYKNYINSHSKSNRIYSRDEVLDMPLRRIRDNKLELESQYRSIGVPTAESLRFSENVVWVEEYTRDDGTKVSGHWRSKPDGGSISDPMRSIVPQDNGSTWEMNMTGDAADGNDSENPIQSILSTIMEMLRLNSQDSSNSGEEGVLTGGAADVNDTKLLSDSQNNFNNNFDYDSIYKEYKNFENPLNSIMYTLGSFLTNYYEMKDANTPGADKYFHARANYDAAQYGMVSSMFAQIISDIREFTDFFRNIYEKGYTKEYSAKDIEEDQQANNQGRAKGLENHRMPANKALEYLMPERLPERYKKK